LNVSTPSSSVYWISRKTNNPKIKATYSFAEHVFDKKCSTARLNPLFKDAGKIREIQLNIRVLSAFPHPPKRLISKLKRYEKILSEEFIANELFHIKSIKKFRNGNNLPIKSIDIKKITKYFDKVKSQLALKKNSEDLHRYRIRLKRMMHVCTMLPSKLQHKLHFDIEKIDTLQQDLGDWHDIYTVTTLVSNEQIPKKSLEYITKLKLDESTQYNTFFNNHKLKLNNL